MKDQRVPGNGVLVGFANQLPSDLSLILKDEGIIGKVICRDIPFAVVMICSTSIRVPFTGAEMRA